MSYENILREEIHTKIEHMLSQGQALHANWITHAICQEHEAFLPESEGREYWQWCGYKTTRDYVRRCISKRLEPNEKSFSPQISLPGFDHLQTHYLVSRNGEDEGVPIQQMTDAELERKAAQYRSMAAACYAHADEIDRYREMREAGAA